MPKTNSPVLLRTGDLDSSASNSEMLTGHRYISRMQAAQMLAVSVQSIDKLIKNETFPAIHVGRAVRIKLSDLMAALEVHAR